jgi:hypothetical protein
MQFPRHRLVIDIPAKPIHARVMLKSAGFSFSIKYLKPALLYTQQLNLLISVSSTVATMPVLSNGWSALVTTDSALISSHSAIL